VFVLGACPSVGVHVITQKGRGYAPAENDEVKAMHDTSELKDGSYTAAFSDAIVKEGERFPQLVAITAAMPDSTGLLPFGERFPDRLIDVGIAEQHAVTAAAGMAMGGLRPVFAVYSTFLTRAFDQVNLDVGLHNQPVVFVLDRAGITGDDGASHHGVLDMVLLTKVPGMTVFAPSSYSEVGQMLSDALEFCTGPAAIRFPKTMPPAPEPGDCEPLHGNPGVRDEPRFQPGPGSHPHHLMTLGQELSRHRQRRIHVAAGAPGQDHHARTHVGLISGAMATASMASLRTRNRMASAEHITIMLPPP